MTTQDRASAAPFQGASADSSDELQLASHTPCTQSGYSFIGYREQAGHVYWRYNNANAQSHITTTEFADLTKTGFDGMLTARNDCGFSDVIALTATRAGSTTAGTGVQDGVNTMGWGFLSGDRLGRIYWWSNGSNTIEFDVRFTTDEVNERLAESIGSTCGNSYDFKGVALHEVMHGYGFGHTSSDLQTMHGTTNRCDTNWYTMGKGDWQGVDFNY